MARPSCYNASDIITAAGNLRRPKPHRLMRDSIDSADGHSYPLKLCKPTAYVHAIRYLGADRRYYRMSEILIQLKRHGCRGCGHGTWNRGYGSYKSDIGRVCVIGIAKPMCQSTELPSLETCCCFSVIRCSIDILNKVVKPTMINTYLLATPYWYLTTLASLLL